MVINYPHFYKHHKTMTKTQLILSYIIVILASLLVGGLITCALLGITTFKASILFSAMIATTGWCFFCMIMDYKTENK